MWARPAEEQGNRDHPSRGFVATQNPGTLTDLGLCFAPRSRRRWCGRAPQFAGFAGYRRLARMRTGIGFSSIWFGAPPNSSAISAPRKFDIMANSRPLSGH
jgi:hypothetical protein